MELKTADGVPTTEFSQVFLQGMVDRMTMSYHKYGKVADAFPSKVDAVRSMQKRLDLYEQTGNTEHLIDAANFLMIEFMCPKHPEAHFTPEDSSGSPGRSWYGEIDNSKRGNKEL